MSVSRLTSFVVLGLSPLAHASGWAQEPVAAATLVQSSQQPIPNLVRTQGILASHVNERLVVRFSIYATEQGRDPLWSEDQLVRTDSRCEYSALLGAGSAIGLPQALFVAGQPRWLSVQIGEHEESRTLLTSVPYALKAADADSLGGQPAASFVTQRQLMARLKAAAAALASQAMQPLTAATPTGAGTTGYLPIWTAASALGNSALIQTGTGTTAKIGIAASAPAATLDVNGTAIFRNKMVLTGLAATATTGVSSPALQFSASSFLNGGSAVAQNFAWQVQPLSNNTATPSSKLALLFASGTANPATTGLSIAPNGIITFATGQSFPSTANAFPKGATFGAESSFTGSSTDWMLVATNTSATSKGTILGQASKGGTGVEGASPGGIGVEGISDTGYGLYGISNTTGTAVYGGAYGTGLAGNFWSQNAAGPAVRVSNVAGGTGLLVTSNLGIGISGVSTTQPAVYASSTSGPAVNGVASTGYAGSFSNVSTYQATVNATNGGAGNAGFFSNNSASHVALAGVNASTDPNAIGTYGNVSNGKAVYGIVTTSGTGVYGTSPGSSGSSGVAGVATSGGNGVYGYSANGIGVYAGSNGDTDATALYANGGANAVGLQADTVAGPAVQGHSTDNYGGAFETDNSNGFALLALNNGSGGSHTLFNVFKATGANGTCGFSSAGDLSCTGQVKSIVTTGKARQVETYSMQSPENWLEDFGSGSVLNGVAMVVIDPAFVETISDSADYHVFLSPRGDSKGLYVTNATASGFEVRESGGGKSSLAFDYRIVAKRRGVEALRLVDVTEKLHAEIEASRPKPRNDGSASLPSEIQSH